MVALLSTKWVDYVEEPMKYQALRPKFFSMDGWGVVGQVVVGWVGVCRGGVGVVGWVVGWGWVGVGRGGSGRVNGVGWVEMGVVGWVVVEWVGVGVGRGGSGRVDGGGVGRDGGGRVGGGGVGRGGGGRVGGGTVVVVG